MDFTFRQLEIFRAVVVAGSITKASHRIDLSQPSISQQLAKLEDSLGVQLINRNRTGSVSLTPAGEYWYRSAVDLIERVQMIVHEHDQTFRSSNLVLKLGVTPSFRGRFLSAAARIAKEEANFSRFEVVYEMTSFGLVEQLRMHKVNMAVVAAEALVDEASSFAIGELWRDNMLWAVPAEVPDDDLRRALTGRGTGDLHPLLAHYVELDPAAPSRSATDDWYRTYLPGAVPTFRAPTFATAIEFVADGLCTSNVLRSLVPNLSQIVLRNVKLFQIDGFERTGVLAMRKHLLSHPYFGRVFHRIIEYCQHEYAPAMHSQVIRPLSDLLRTPAGG
ncbi:MAG: LysR family transcriptional regulator [Gemmobacter sp.]|jgi:DNA-binding transcriptional LysR family regulator|nr:LysR family transcriptional regulator [Gemmobacter sp.]